MTPKSAASLSLSLVSHTNAGKTTLARTLLCRDVGEVRDAPHVTEFADVFTLLEAENGERLLLWDTPGFGDSARLVKRLRATANPLGWFASAVWDRWRDRPFWSSQQALRNVRDEADVLLYLVNASESPEAAGYVAPEMDLLGWVGKPVVVLLNQLGPPRAAAVEAAEVERWRQHLAAQAHVKAVLPLDAFARCWVQEIALLQAIEHTLSGERQALMARLRVAWLQQQQQRFAAAMQLLAESMARVAVAREKVTDAVGLKARLRQLGAALGVSSTQATPAEAAQHVLAQQLDAELRSSTLALIQLHGLRGEAPGELLKRLSTQFELRLRLDEGKAALWGGMVSGAVAGLTADIASAGLTLGGGLLAGGLIGALSGAGLARCVNLVRGTQASWVAWNTQALHDMLEAALLRYLAVAHFGRGRGDWAEAEAPPHWRQLVAEALATQRATLTPLWRERNTQLTDDTQTGAHSSLTKALTAVLSQATTEVLEKLYPKMT
jgi:hypothetical protein